MNSQTRTANYFLSSPTSKDLGSVRLQNLWADVFGLFIDITDPSGAECLANAVEQALATAKEFGARTVVHRLILDRQTADETRNQLITNGFRFKGGRVEFKASIDGLPTDDGTPLKWKSAKELNIQRRDIAEVIAQVSLGDPGADPDDDPLSFIEDFMHDPVLTSGPECIHLGYVDDVLAAMTVVQINPQSGWSRISYMGVVPAFRRRGLGTWVHRYGFKMMKLAGGKLYHGGTDATNQPMISLFEKNGCALFRRMEEWTFEVKNI